MFIVDYLKSQRVFTDQGFLKVPGRLARTGIQTYYAFELGIRDGDPMRRIRVYRPESEVFAPESMASFEDNPVTIEHPEVAVTADNWAELAHGHVRNIRRDGIYLVGDLTITDRAAIKALEEGKVEISNGYAAQYIFEKGVTPEGEEYDAKQTTIRGNHVALVDAARCGPACRVSDSNQSGARQMPTKKITIDGLPLEFDESAVVVIEKLVGDRDAARTQATELQTKLAAAVITGMVGDKSLTVPELVALVAARDSEIESLKKDVMTPDARDAMVEAWAKMIADAKRIAPTVDTKGKTCNAIRREVVTKLHTGDHKVMIDAVLGGNTPETATEEQIKTAFAVLSAAAPVQAATTDADDAVQQALMGDAKRPNGDQLDGRDAYLARNANAWQTPAGK